LTTIAVVGVVTTTVLAVKATPQAHTDIQNAKSETTEDLTIVDVVKLTYKHYLPSVATGILTVACVIGSNHVNTKRTAALASVYGLTEAAFREYREKVVEHIGTVKEQKVRDEVNQDVVDRIPVESKQIIVTDTGNVLFLEKLSGRIFASDVETVRKAVNDVNYLIINDMYASLNDFYYKLSLPPNDVGETLGWTTDRLLELEEFTATVFDGKPCLVIDYRAMPKPKYNKFG
jgi:hypothetical protein